MKNPTAPARMLLLALLLFSYSCKEKDVIPAPAGTADNGDAADTGYSAVNSWIYEVTEDAYYWYQHLPALASLDLNASPSKFFEQLVYQRTATDRFSTITDNIHELEDEFNGVSAIFGISYSIAYTDDAKSRIGLFISYVVNGSPAESAGIARGDIITKINDTQLTADNYYSLLSDSETITFSKARLSGKELLDSGISGTMTRAVVTENPIVFYNVIDKTAYGKKIGYLVYNQFLPGTGSNENEYDDQLRSIFATFKQQDINELVIDLRFNPGGYMSSAETLASLIGKNVGSGKIFYKEEWNSKYQAYFRRTHGEASLSYPFLNEAGNVGSNISRVFVLTSNGTASASELVINGLAPYMEVITIGENTYGKNLFGTLIDDEEERWDWGLYLMLGRVTNVNGESDYGTVNGITPTYYVEDNSIPYQPFGSDNETLFKKVLEIMGIPAGSASRTAASAKVERLSRDYYRDGLKTRSKEMIRNWEVGVPPGR